MPRGSISTCDQQAIHPRLATAPLPGPECLPNALCHGTRGTPKRTVEHCCRSEGGRSQQHGGLAKPSAQGYQLGLQLVREKPCQLLPNRSGALAVVLTGRGNAEKRTAGRRRESVRPQFDGMSGMHEAGARAPWCRVCGSSSDRSRQSKHKTSGFCVSGRCDIMPLSPHSGLPPHTLYWDAVHRCM